MMPRMIRPRPPIHHQPGPGHHGPRGPPRGVPPPHVAPFTAGPPVPPSASAVGNVTNNPSTAKSRVFVGNLNTIALTKEEVESIFSRYGYVTGISLHKGYAFVQYANEHDARRACIAEDGMLYAGQTLDINIASEPKNRANPVSTKPTTTQTSGSGATRVTLTQGGPPAKKQRLESQPSIKRTLVNLTSSGSGEIKTAANKSITQLTQAAKDVLICGVCKTSFSSLHSLAQHKKIPCRLKISCQCQSTPPPESPEPTQLLCASCGAEFASAWDLVQHCQQEHSISIYKSDADGGEITEVIEEEVIVQNDGGGELNGQ